MCWLGMESFVLKFVAAPNPAPFPLGQRGICWLLSILLVSSIIWLFISLVVRRIRRLVSFVIGGLILTGVLIVLIVMPLHYAQGDNPDSPLYCADLVRQAGFRYFWNQRPWNEIDIEGNLILQERSISGGRPSILDIAKLDDGLQCMTFGRNHKGRGGSKSMQMLTQENLEDLCEKEGTCIIYIHWVELPKQIFTAEALLNLERLKSLNETGQIWLASTYDILHFTFIRAFLEYQVQRQNGGYILNIVQVNDPINEAFIPSLVDLQGISFECPLGDKIEIRLAGKSLGRDAFDVIKDKGQQIIRFRLQSN